MFILVLKIVFLRIIYKQCEIFGFTTAENERAENHGSPKFVTADENLERRQTYALFSKYIQKCLKNSQNKFITWNEAL